MQSHEIERKTTTSLSDFTPDEIEFIVTNSKITKEVLSDPGQEPYLLYYLLLESHNPKKNELAELLIRKVKEINMSCTFIAVMLNQDVTTLKLLLRYKKDRTDIGSFLFEAIRSNQAESVKFLLENGVDPNFSPPRSFQSPLHQAVQLGSLPIVSALIKRGASLTTRDIKGRIPIDIAFLYKMSHVVNFLLESGSDLPTESKRYLTQSWPDIGQIEVYNEVRKCFSFVTQELVKTVQASKKNAAVLFFAEQENHQEPFKEKTVLQSKSKKYWLSRVPQFEGISKFYDPEDIEVAKWYGKLSEHFILFRILIRKRTEMVPVLEEVHDYLGPEQEIMHLAIEAHSDSEEMILGYEGEAVSSLSIWDKGTTLTMQEVFSYLSPNATVALSGCSTAKDLFNLTQRFSDPAISDGRLVFGTTDSCSYNRFTLFQTPDSKKAVCIPFFSVEDKAMVGAYKNGEEIARGEWPLRSKL